MQRMNVADRMKNGKRTTDGGGATHTKGPHKSGPPHRGPHKAANRRPQRDPHRKHTDTVRHFPSRKGLTPNLKPRTVCVCGTSGLRKGVNTTQHPSSPAFRARTDLATNVQAVSRAVSYVTLIVPGSRLGKRRNPTQSPASRARTDLATNIQAVSRAVSSVSYVTLIVPGSRLGPDLPTRPPLACIFEYPACMPPVSCLYLTVSLVFRCIPVSIYI